jgi:hypothetical protein
MEPGVKIEIGESLIYSWLRHVQGCVVTQINWKPSPTWEVAKERELTVEPSPHGHAPQGDMSTVPLYGVRGRGGPRSGPGA